ncbi:hypothetical protein AX15_000409 [Amanita polypyramis BW_CC]|nr:hypothetical protein AX15_000409 [Amanita polypyramis BW_CC]
MSLTISRHYASALCSRLIVRRYATGNVQVQQKQAAKGAARMVAPRSASTPNTSAPKTTAKSGSVSAEAASVESLPSRKEPGTTTTAQNARQDERPTEEEMLEQVEMIRAMSRMFPTADPWGQRVDTLDVIMPSPVTSAARSRFPSFRPMLDQFFNNRLNDSKNATSLLLLAKADAIPGVDLSKVSLFQKLVTSWPWRIFTAQSTRTGSWLEPLRKLALSTYKDLNVAVAQQDDKQIKRLTAASHQDNVLRMLKKTQNPSHTYIWRFHREVSPTKVLSIRGTEGHLGAEDPKFGNRMLVHALLKFDTEQSLEVYDKRGRALHKPVDGGPSFGQGAVPAQRRRVTEYLVIEKRMWYDGPWTFREQMYENRPTQ